MEEMREGDVRGDEVILGIRMYVLGWLGITRVVLGVDWYILVARQLV